VVRSTLHSLVATTAAVAVVGGTIAGVAVARHHHNDFAGGGNTTAAGSNGGGNAANPGHKITNARLEGTWQINAGTMSGTWTFTPSCSNGPCGGSSSRTADDFGAQGTTLDVTGTFTFSGGTFSGKESYTATCGSDVSTPFPVPVADAFQLSVAQAARVNGELVATKITGVTTHTAQLVQNGSSACGYDVGTVPLSGHRIS
jgi:hypothetical protein